MKRAKNYGNVRWHSLFLLGDTLLGERGQLERIFCAGWNLPTLKPRVGLSALTLTQNSLWPLTPWNTSFWKVFFLCQ